MRFSGIAQCSDANLEGRCDTIDRQTAHSVKSQQIVPVWTESVEWWI